MQRELMSIIGFWSIARVEPESLHVGLFMSSNASMHKKIFKFHIEGIQGG